MKFTPTQASELLQPTMVSRESRERKINHNKHFQSQDSHVKQQYQKFRSKI